MGLLGGQCPQNSFKRRGIRGAAASLSIDEFSLDAEVGGLAKKVHSARSLHATEKERREILQKRKEVNGCLTLGLALRSRGTNGGGAASIYVRNLSFCATGRDGFSYLDGITVNKAIETLESAAAGGAFLIENVYPLVDGGRYPVKRLTGERIEVWADIYRYGSQAIEAALLWHREQDHDWHRVSMQLYGDDRWTGAFQVDEAGRYVFAIEAWSDEFANWRRTFEQKRQAGIDVVADALEGASLLTRAQAGGKAASTIILRQCDAYLQSGDPACLLTDDLAGAMSESQWRHDLTRSPLFSLSVEPRRASVSAWYQMMPRSQGKRAGAHGTLADCIERLPDIAGMGFDVVCLTPIHPIGASRRRGRNDEMAARPGDPGNPYAVGDPSGGHDAIHPELGTPDDFRHLLATCKRLGIELALDFALTCSPDHPWIKQHPEWFQFRPDGSIKTADDQPKSTGDIVRPDFASEDAGSLWNAWRDIALFWCEQGVRTFRVSDPDEQPQRFWEWLIHEVQLLYPETVFLAAAVERSKPMKGLAKAGFTQSTGHFDGRTQRAELQTYWAETAAYPERDYLRPNLFVNSLDLLPFHLQGGEPWMFKSRLALAATLSGNYGMFNGFELLEHQAIPGTEEYLDSEKFEIRTRDWNQPGNIKSFIRAINLARRQNAALQQTANFQFLSSEDDNVISFVKQSVNQSNSVVVVIALSPSLHDFWLPLGEILIGLQTDRRPLAMLEDLFTGERHRVEWGGVRLRIDPMRNPALLFRCLA